MDASHVLTSASSSSSRPPHAMVFPSPVFPSPVFPSPGKLLDVPTAMSFRGRAALIGVVVDAYGDIGRSGAMSCYITFTIKDSNLTNGHTWDGLKIRYFAANENQLPPVRQGDVILLRNIWIKNMGGNPLGVAAQNQVTPWAIFRQNADPTAPIRGPSQFELSTPETRQCHHLLKSIRETSGFRNQAVEAIPPSSAFRSPTHYRATPASGSPTANGVQASAARPTPNSGSRKRFSLIKDVEFNRFVDLVCEVVKVDPSDSRNCLIYVTDYTSNPNLHNYGSGDGNEGTEGDPYNYQRIRKPWPGPKGQMTFPVVLWEPHASHGRQLQPSDLVHLQNVRIKQSPNNQLEGAIHTDQKYPEKVTIHMADEDDDDDRCKELLRRKQEYWKQNPKRKATIEDKPAPKSKKTKKQQRKQEQAKREEGQKTLTIEKQKHVEAANMAQPPVTIEQIVNNPSHNNVSPDGIEYRLPFQNLSYRPIVRVVDFFPPNLRDFAVPERPQYSSQSDDEPCLLTAADGHTTWEWRFCLLVESARPPPPGQRKERLKLFVDHPSAQYLLDLDPTDLRKDQAIFKQLREKLFLLWGNLEEEKKKAIKEQRPIGPISSRPFECCIQEYGVVCAHRAAKDDYSHNSSRCTQGNCLGWEPRYAMFMTTITE